MPRTPEPRRATEPPNVDRSRTVPERDGARARPLAPWRVAHVDPPSGSSRPDALSVSASATDPPDLSLVALRLVRAAALALRATDATAADVGEWLLPHLDRRLAAPARDEPDDVPPAGTGSAD